MLLKGLCSVTEPFLGSSSSVPLNPCLLAVLIVEWG